MEGARLGAPQPDLKGVLGGGFARAHDGYFGRRPPRDTDAPRSELARMASVSDANAGREHRKARVRARSRA